MPTRRRWHYWPHDWRQNRQGEDSKQPRSEIHARSRQRWHTLLWGGHVKKSYCHSRTLRSWRRRLWRCIQAIEVRGASSWRVERPLHAGIRKDWAFIQRIYMSLRRWCHYWSHDWRQNREGEEIKHPRCGIHALSSQRWQTLLWGENVKSSYFHNWILWICGRWMRGSLLNLTTRGLSSNSSRTRKSSSSSRTSNSSRTKNCLKKIWLYWF